MILTDARSMILTWKYTQLRFKKNVAEENAREVFLGKATNSSYIKLINLIVHIEK